MAIPTRFAAAAGQGRSATHLHLRSASPTDDAGIREVIQAAFAGKPGLEVADLAASLTKDPTAAPMVSLVALADDRVVGQVLFTRVRIEGHGADVAASILAPLSVHPDFQDRGIGGRLIERGLKELKEAGQDLVFVLGHPGYYPRYGFIPAGVRGFSAPYPIPDRNADAWMVQALQPGIMPRVQGRVSCADSLNDPRHWRE